MKKYYIIDDIIKPYTAFAYTNDNSLISHEILIDVINQELLPFEFHLKYSYLKKGEVIVEDDLSKIKHLWLDNQPNNLAWPLFSNKMKSIIEAHLTGNEKIHWILAKVNSNTETRDYYIPQFTEKLDILNVEKTTFVENTNHIIIPTFAYEKIRKFSMFHKSQESRWQITSGLYVSEELRKDLINNKVTGIAFEKTRVD